MGKEIITQKQGIVIMITFLLGSSLVLGTGGAAEQDIWIAILAAIVIAIPTFFVYARLLSIYPGKSLFEVAEVVLGKVAGGAVTLLFAGYAFYLGSLVIRNFTEFIKIVSLTETPQYSIAIPMVLLCIWAVKAGVEVVGRWTSIVLPILILSIIAVLFLMLPLTEWRNLKPILYEGLKPVMNNAFSAFSFPFAETVLFTAVLHHLRSNSSSYKVYYWSLAISGIIIVLVAVRNLLVLGTANMSVLFFPTYAAVRLINIGEFLQRIEVLVSIVFLFAGFVKISICLYTASNGIAKVFKMENYRQIVAPVGLLMMMLSFVVYRNAMEMFEWANKTYKYFAFPFQVIIPILILIAAETKVRFARKRRAGM